MSTGFFADVQSRWMAAMREGDFEAAWKQTDRIEFSRRALERAGKFKWHPHFLLWNGEPFRDRRVLVRCNHGLGDTLQFLRFIPWLVRDARQVTLLAQPALVPLLSGVPGFGTVCDGWSSGPRPCHDIEMEIMELAYAFRSTPETLPRRVPYIPHDHVRSLGHSSKDLSWDGAIRVGLVWAASDWNAARSIRLAELEPLAKADNVKFFSLQQGNAAADASTATFPLTPLSPVTKRIDEAAAALLQLDLLITVDSMPAHLAGALGRPVWLLLQHDADWRWMRGRGDSPWYPTMRLFRQKEPGDWRGVVSSIAFALEELAAEHRVTSRRSIALRSAKAASLCGCQASP
jgi:hypothetical protein